MLELHNAFLVNFQKYWKNDKPDYLTWPEIDEIKSGIDVLQKMINSGSFNINEKDQDGNTLLHLILDTENKYLQHTVTSFYDEPLYILIHATLKMGADLTIKNNNNLTPIGLYFTKKIHGISPEDLLFLIKKIDSSDEKIIPVLDGILNEFPNKDFSVLLFFMHELSLDTLKSILRWTEKIDNQKNAVKVKEQLEGQIMLLEKAFDLPAIIHELTNAQNEKRVTFFRAMLLGGELPLEALLNQIVKEDVFSDLHPHQHCAFKCFIEEYEKRRLMLEAFSAIPTALTNTELSLVKPICDKLNSILYNFQAPNSDKEWKKRVKEYEDSDQKRMADRYAKYQDDDRINRTKLFSEFHQYQGHIKNGTFLGKNSIYAKNNQRKKCAEAAEQRLRNQKK